MALPLGLSGSSNGSSEASVSHEVIRRGLDSLEDSMQKVSCVFISVFVLCSAEA